MMPDQCAVIGDKQLAPIMDSADYSDAAKWLQMSSVHGAIAANHVR